MPACQFDHRFYRTAAITAAAAITFAAAVPVAITAAITAAAAVPVTITAAAAVSHQGAYFIGKAIWGKGYRELINLGAEYEQVGTGFVGVCLLAVQGGVWFHGSRG